MVYICFSGGQGDLVSLADRVDAIPMTMATRRDAAGPRTTKGAASLLVIVLAWPAFLLGVTLVPRDSSVSRAVDRTEPRALTVHTTAAITKPEAPVVATTTAPTVVLPPTMPPPPPPAVTTGCADALAYLAAHQAPGFVDDCGPGSALGHYGYSCWNIDGRCPHGSKIIHVACPAPFVYMNEAHNSWTLIGQGSGIDPYGEGSPSEQAFCEGLR